MVNMTKFAERLDELIFENKTSVIPLAKIMKIDETSIYNYLNQRSIPSLQTTLKLVEYFRCSIDYLFARTDENNYCACPQLPPFDKQLKFVFEYFKSNEHQLTKQTKISRSISYGWLSGKAVPSIDNLSKIADCYDCSIDFVLGREK